MEKNERPEQAPPLETPPPKTVRFNKRVVIGLVATIAIFVLFAVIAAFSPEKTAQGEEVKAGKDEEQKSRTSPGLPDPVVSAIGDYRDIPRTKAASSSPAPQQASAPAGGEAASAPGTPAAGETAAAPRISQQYAPAYTIEPPNQEQDQTRKDAASAVNSPLTFGQSDPLQQAKPGEPKTELIVPPLGLLRGNDSRPAAMDDQNMQGEKRDFSRERPAELPYVKTTLISPISQYEVKAGSILPATLITGINSDLPGQIVAQLRESVYDTVTGNFLLIPQGTRLIGEYDSKIAFGQERILVIWTRLIMPNGDSISLEGMPGTDLSGYAGMTGKVNNHYGKLITGVVLGSVIGAGAQVAVGGQGAANVPPSFGQMAVSGAAQSINQSAQQHTSKILNMQPTIEVAPGDKINVFVTKDMILKPFAE